MKFLIVFVALFAIAFANDVEILKRVVEVGPESFEYAVETSDGNKQFATGHVNNPGTEDESLSVKGAYEWVHPETGEKFTVEYIADENGFQPTGAHLPVVPAF